MKYNRLKTIDDEVVEVLTRHLSKGVWGYEISTIKEYRVMKYPVVNQRLMSLVYSIMLHAKVIRLDLAYNRVISAYEVL